MPPGTGLFSVDEVADGRGVIVESRAYAGLAGVECPAASLHLPVIHISSHEVFAPLESGQGFFEQDRPGGHEARALALIEAEEQARALGKAIILRLPLLVDLQSGHWFDALLTRLSTQDWLGVSETTRLDPVCMKEACRVVIALAQQIACGAENWGVMHLRSAEPCFEAEFADHVVRQLKKEQMPAAQLDVTKGPSTWTGPLSVLAGRRLTDTFGVQMRSWRLGVKPLMQRWIDEKRAQDAHL